MSHHHTTEMNKQRLFVLRYRKAKSVQELVEFYPINLIHRKLVVLQNHWNFTQDYDIITFLLNELITIYPEEKFPEYYL